MENQIITKIINNVLENKNNMATSYEEIEILNNGIDRNVNAVLAQFDPKTQETRCYWARINISVSPMNNGKDIH